MNNSYQSAAASYAHKNVCYLKTIETEQNLT